MERASPDRGLDDRSEHGGARLKRRSPTYSPDDPPSKRPRYRSRSPRPYSDRYHDHDHRHRDYDSPPRRDSSLQPPRERRKQVTQEEKKRGQRLFGGLLSTLSQKSSIQQTKRQEIEKRQQERARQKKAENEKHRSERLGRVNSIRLAEQVRLEEDMMHARHRNSLAMARYLRTKSKPPIYYLPYRLTREQEDTIDDGIQEAEAAAAAEVESFKLRRVELPKAAGLGRGGPPRQQEPPLLPAGTSSAPPPPAGETHKPNRDDDATDATNNLPGDGEKSKVQVQSQGFAAEKKEVVGASPRVRDHAEDGDVLVEAEEDTVIY